MNGSDSYITHVKDMKKVNEVIEYIAEHNYCCDIALKACNALGIPQAKLMPRSPEDFDNGVQRSGSGLMKFQNFEARRQARLMLVAEYLLESKLYKREVNKLARSQLPVLKTEKILGCLSVTPNQMSSHRFEILKNSIKKRMKFEENRKLILQEQERIRVKLQQNLNKTPKRYLSDSKKNFFEVQNKRINDRLEQKYKNLIESEQNALSISYFSKELSSPSSLSLHNTRKRPSLVLRRTPEEEIQRNLSKIEAKLEDSAIRAKKVLEMKASSGRLSSLKFNKILNNKRTTLNKVEEEKFQKVLMIQKSTIDATERRLKILEFDVAKRSKSNKAMLERSLEAMLKVEQGSLKKLRNLEARQIHRESVIKSLRKRYEKKSESIIAENSRKKQSQVINLTNIQNKLCKIRKIHLEKICSPDPSMTKASIDLPKLRAQIEFELKAKN